MDPQVLGLINLSYLISFVVLVGLAVARIGTRYVDYKRQGLEVPLLLKRDFIFLTGLSLPFVGIFLFRATGVIPQREPWAVTWTLISGALALAATAIWVYIEYFKIEQK